MRLPYNAMCLHCQTQVPMDLPSLDGAVVINDGERCPVCENPSELWVWPSLSFTIGVPPDEDAAGVAREIAIDEAGENPAGEPEEPEGA